MKRRRFALVATALCAVATMCLGGCSSGESARVQRQERRQFQIVMESKLRQLDSGIARLAGLATPADTIFAHDVEDLRRDQLELREKLATMDAVSDGEWTALRDSLESCYHEVREQYGVLSRYEPAVVPSSSALVPAASDSSVARAPASLH